LTNPLLTIVIPTFNSGKTLEQCLDSVVNQKFRNFEVWIIDGGSGDNTVDICKNYSTRYDFLNFVSEPDKGIYDAMNKGIAKALGTWMYFLGSDDYLVNQFVLEALLTEKNTNTFDFIYGNVIWGDSCFVYAGRFDWIRLASGSICHQAIFYRKSIFDALGVYNLKYPLFADQDMNQRIFHSSYRILYINKIVAFFSLDGSSGRGSDPLQQEMIHRNRTYVESKTLSEKIQYYYFVTRPVPHYKLRKFMLGVFYFILNFRDIRTTRTNIGMDLYPWETN
jgi:glycosyltransferase involved in cell wall biosynthesis